jgi:NhaA family Na+:H+ antiporter
VGLVTAALIALVVANIPSLAQGYDRLLHATVTIGIEPYVLKKGLLHFINDGLMAIFFLLVGLEIKREVLEGELNGREKLVLPVVAATGGVIVPALLFVALAGRDPQALQGWAIPAATDIAFALGALSLAGPRVPLSLKVFLTAVAVVDDLVAILVIAIFYSGPLVFAALGVAAGAIAVLLGLNRLGVASRGPYLLVGLILWLAVLKSGIHATLAGVVLGLLIPLRDRRNPDRSPLRSLEQDLHVPVAFFILPVFAFANAGVTLTGMGPAALVHPVALGIAAGLILGKPIGIVGAVALAAKIGGAPLPSGSTWASMVAVGVLCGIGFTMSLFIGALAYEGLDPVYAAATRVGVLGASLIASTLGVVLLRRAVNRKREGEGDRRKVTQA